MSREDPQLKLRLTDVLKMRVTAAAKANNRSVNAEIVAALEEKFPGPRSIDELVAAADELRMQVESATGERKAELQKRLGPILNDLGVFG